MSDIQIEKICRFERRENKLQMPNFNISFRENDCTEWSHIYGDSDLLGIF